MKRTYDNQFTISEELPLYIPKFLLEKPWEDTSWGNDAAPSFFNHEKMIRVFVNYDKPEDREMAGDPKYFASNVTVELEYVENAEQLETDDEEVLKQWLDAQHNFDTADMEDLNTNVIEAGKLITQALELAQDMSNEELINRLQAVLDEINTIINT